MSMKLRKVKRRENKRRRSAQRTAARIQVNARLDNLPTIKVPTWRRLVTFILGD